MFLLDSFLIVLSLFFNNISRSFFPCRNLPCLIESDFVEILVWLVKYNSMPAEISIVSIFLNFYDSKPLSVLDNHDIISFLSSFCRTKYWWYIEIFSFFNFLWMDYQCHVNVLPRCELAESFDSFVLQIELVESSSLSSKKKLEIVNDYMLHIVHVDSVFDSLQNFL